MQIWENLRSHIGGHAWHSIESKTLRFRTAVLLGFFITSAALAAIGPGAKSPLAQNVFWNNLFGVTPTPGPEQAPSTSAKVKRMHRFTTHFARAGSRARGAATVSRLAICVRGCDGFSFPLGPYAGEKGRQRQEEMCQTDCPGPGVALYVLPPGSDKIEDAVNASSGESYSKLPGAFRYKTLVDDACTCTKPGKLMGPNMALLNDVTLRRGDAVMTASGLQVYHGGASFPHQRSDFVALALSRDIPKSQLTTVHEIERASRRPLAEASKNVFDTLFSQVIPVPPRRFDKEARRD